jgi:glycosyltransferase involved in cell wall biosynthesis
VIDDGSGDGTAGHLVGWPVTIVTLPHAGIISGVRNAGIRRARGAFIVFLDSDDLWLPGKLRRQLDHFAAHPEVGGRGPGPEAEGPGPAFTWPTILTTIGLGAAPSGVTRARPRRTDVAGASMTDRAAWWERVSPRGPLAVRPA